MTVIASEGIESCRKACGGHGYSHFSGLPLLYEDYVAACTYEGENTIMHLQTARYLMKVARQSLAGEKLAGNCNYLEKLAENLKKRKRRFSSSSFLLAFDAILDEHHHILLIAIAFPETVGDLLQPSFQLNAYRRRAASAIYDTLLGLESKRKEGQSGLFSCPSNVCIRQKGRPNPHPFFSLSLSFPIETEAWNSSLVDLVRCSQAHCQYILLTNFISSLDQLPETKSKRVLKQLCDLFALHTMEKFLGEFTESGILPSKQIKMLRATIQKLLTEIRPNAVSLVDSWCFHDYELNSALGRYDGNVYEALYKWAQKAPLNKTQEGPAYKSILKPKFNSNL